MSKLHGNTGCSVLDKAGIKRHELYKGAGICLSCPLEKCVLDRNNPVGEEVVDDCVLTEITVQCQTCLQLETLTICDGKLQAGRYRQFFNRAYHKKNIPEKKRICGVCKVFE